MKTNVLAAAPRTHEGAVGQRISQEQELRRAVCSCMLFEDQFYEGGQSIADRIVSLAKAVKPETVRSLAIEARSRMKLRHVPLLLLATLAENGGLTWQTVEQVIQRSDELGELVAIYWRNGKKSLKKSLKKGLAAAFLKQNEYGLAKYDRAGKVRLRDVLFLSHAKPRDDEQAALWKRLIAGELVTPDTWEVALSAATDKKSTWERLLAEDKLGALALIRNLRNMLGVQVPIETIRLSLGKMKVDRVLPFRFVAAARHAVQLEPDIELAIFKCLEGTEQIAGETILLVDVSGSMDSQLSGKSEMTCIDAAYGLAILLREVAAHGRVFTFSNSLVEVPARRGFALRDAIKNSQPHGGTNLGAAIAALPKTERLIVLTDEQSHDSVGTPNADRGYIINVASYQVGVAYDKFVHINGWSEACLDFIREYERIASDSIESAREHR